MSFQHGSNIKQKPYLMIFRYWQVKKKCPKCEYQWSDDIGSTMFNLRKVRKFRNVICPKLQNFKHDISKG